MKLNTNIIHQHKNYMFVSNNKWPQAIDYDWDINRFITCTLKHFLISSIYFGASYGHLLYTLNIYDLITVKTE